MAVDPGTVIGALIIGLANLGAAKFLLRRSLGQQDEMAKTLSEHSLTQERIVLTQKTTAETLVKVQDSIAELYTSRNQHEKEFGRVDKEVSQIDTLHNLKGCKTFFQGANKGKEGGGQ
jgi:phage-related minor tail protein